MMTSGNQSSGDRIEARSPTDQRDTPDTPRGVELNPGFEPDLIGEPETVTGHVLRRPDTRTPSAEGCGHSAHATDEDGRRVGADGAVLPTRTMRWELCPTGRDALVERLRLPFVTDSAHREAANALEDLTRENERLRAEVERVWRYFETDAGSLVRQRDTAASRLALVRHALLADGYFTDDEIGPDLAPRVVERFSVYAAERDEARRQVAAVRALREGWESYPEGSEHRVAARWLRAALDTASEDRGDSRGQEKRNG